MFLFCFLHLTLCRFSCSGVVSRFFFFVCPFSACVCVVPASFDIVFLAVFGLSSLFLFSLFLIIFYNLSTFEYITNNSGIYFLFFKSFHPSFMSPFLLIIF